MLFIAVFFLFYITFKFIFVFFMARWHTTGKTSVSGAESMGFKSRTDQISNTLPTTRHRCNLEVWALAQSRRDWYRSLVIPETLLSEYNKDLIFLLDALQKLHI